MLQLLSQIASIGVPLAQSFLSSRRQDELAKRMAEAQRHANLVNLLSRGRVQSNPVVKAPKKGLLENLLGAANIGLQAANTYQQGRKADKLFDSKMQAAEDLSALRKEQSQLNNLNIQRQQEALAELPRQRAIEQAQRQADLAQAQGLAGMTPDTPVQATVESYSRTAPHSTRTVTPRQIAPSHVIAGLGGGNLERRNLLGRLNVSERAQALDETIAQNKFTIDLAKLQNDLTKLTTSSVEDRATMENALMTQFRTVGRDFIAARDGFAKVQSAAQLDTGAGDISLIFGFFKTIDPASTIREGEFATAENTGGAPERAIQWYNRLRTGERLTPELRAEFVQAAASQFQAQRNAFLPLVDQFTGIAERRGLDPRSIILDIDTISPSNYKTMTVLRLKTLALQGDEDAIEELRARGEI